MKPNTPKTGATVPPPPGSAPAPHAPEAKDNERRRLDERLDEALEESFPASDPTAAHPIRH